MHHQDLHRRTLFAGLTFSALCHLGAGLAIVGARIGVSPHGVASTPAREPEPPVRLGIERSRAVTMNWLGFETPTEHAARRASVEQSAMALDTPPSAASTESVDSESVDAAGARAAEAAIEAGSRLVETILNAIGSARAQAQSSVPGYAGERGAEGAQAPASADPAPRSPAQPQPEARHVESATIDDRAPIITDRESIATALRTAPAVAPGRVLAAQGLEIRTRRPQWTRLTLMTRRPANPVVQITFGRDGRVRRAGFLSDGEHVFSTGFDDVDEPLLNAVFRWTASGAALERLPQGAPDAVVTILVRVILNG